MSTAHLSIESTLGAVFVGFAFSCGAYGILASQIFTYFWHYPSDGLFLKLVVGVLFGPLCDAVLELRLLSPGSRDNV